MIDNYDSFVYNLVRYFKELGEEIDIYRNDKITLDRIEKMQVEGIIISPGPKKPEDAGISNEIIKKFYKTIPILGICLGYQSIGHIFGAKIIRGEQPIHGKISKIMHNGKGIFSGVKNPINVTRYHSLIIDRETLPDYFRVTCETIDGVIMGIAHEKYPLEGVQFHPEAELTECGHDLLKNYIDICKKFKS